MIEDILKRLDNPAHEWNVTTTAAEAAACIRELVAENASLRADIEDTFARGASFGQEALKGVGALVIIDSAEITAEREQAAARIAELEAQFATAKQPQVISDPYNGGWWKNRAEMLLRATEKHGEYCDELRAKVAEVLKTAAAADARANATTKRVREMEAALAIAKEKEPKA